jgi:hypothetical protein
MAPTTITSIALVMFGVGILALTAYGYYLILWAGASVRDPHAHPRGQIDVAVRDLRRQIEDYERENRNT